jgi:hypothetical protein
MRTDPPDRPTFTEQAQRVGQNLGRLASKGFAWWCIAWSALYALAFVLVVSFSENPSRALLGVLAALAAVSALLARHILMRVRGTEVSETMRERLRRVVRLARTHGGILSVADVEAELGFAPDSAEDVLRECSRAGLADVDADTRGVLIYRFHAYEDLSPSAQIEMGSLENQRAPSRLPERH